MVMDAGVERCAEQSPVTVMARLALQRALEPAWIDDLFERERGTQYTRELLFSTTVELMSVVAVGLRPSVHAAAKACKDLPVSVQALYAKIRGTTPSLVRALVQGSATRLSEVLAPMIKDKAPTVRGYRSRIVDGNHLPASEKRLKPRRGIAGPIAGDLRSRPGSGGRSGAVRGWPFPGAHVDGSGTGECAGNRSVDW